MAIRSKASNTHDRIAQSATRLTQATRYRRTLTRQAFEDVANTPGMNARALVVWLQSPHPTMPHFIIPAQDTDNIVSYITSLRTKQ